MSNWRLGTRKCGGCNNLRLVRLPRVNNKRGHGASGQAFACESLLVLRD